jgi:predicted transcriptional regulator
MRRRIVGLVREYPGLHVREVARQLGTSVARIEYHIPLLVEAGLVRSVREEQYQRLYPMGNEGGLGKKDQDALALLRHRIPLLVTLYLLDQDAPVRHRQLAEDLGLSKSKLSFHLRKLEAAAIVARDAEGGFAPTDRVWLLRLLVAFQPTPDLRQEFADLWLGLYGDR